MTHPFITEDVLKVADEACADAYWTAKYDVKIKDVRLEMTRAALLAALPHIEKAIREDERDECERALYVLLDAKTADEKEAIRNQAIWDCAASIRSRTESGRQSED